MIGFAVQLFFMYNGGIRCTFEPVKLFEIDLSGINPDVFAFQFCHVFERSKEPDIVTKIGSRHFLNGTFVPKKEIPQLLSTKDVLQEIEEKQCEGAIRTKLGDLIAFHPGDILLHTQQ